MSDAPPPFTKEQRVTFGVGGLPDGTTAMIIGIPRECWKVLKTGRTQNIDCRRMGLPFTITLFGAESRAQILDIFGAFKPGGPVIDNATDYSIPEEQEAARSFLAEEREAIAAEARRYAAMYPQSSDGRNTFIIFADWVERRAAK